MKTLRTLSLLCLLALGAAAVTISWEFDNTENDPTVGFEVWHSLDNENWSPLLGTASTSIVVETAQQKQFFKIRTTNFWGDVSVFSETVSVPNRLTRGATNVNIRR